MVFSTLRFDWYESLDITRYFYLSWNCGNKFIKSQWWLYQTFTHVGSLALYAISFYFVSIVFRTLSVGLVYAIWSGVGIVLTAIVAYFAFGQKIDTAGLIGMALIISGVLVINLFSQTGH